MFPSSDSAVVNLVEKLPLADSNVVVLVLNEPLSVFNPLILEVAFVILVEKLELVSVKEPLILVAVKLLIKVAFGPNEPLISLDICADELKAPLNIPLYVSALTLPVIFREPVNK